MNTTRMGVGFQGLIDDVIAVLPPLDGLKALYEKEMEIRECLKTLYTAIYSPVFRVSIHFVYLTFISCCLGYVHTSV
jgi:hypothetical protein